MSLKYVILTALTDGPKSGYELKKKFDDHFAYFWKASHQQIYRELNTLAQKEQINCKEVEQSGRPDKKIYSLNTNGKKALIKWAKDFSPSPSNDISLVKLLTFPLLNFDELEEQIQKQIQFHQLIAKEYDKLTKEHFPKKVVNKLKDKDLLIYLSLQRGIITNDAKLKWCLLVKKSIQK